MPDHAKSGGRPTLKPHVQRHLERNGVDHTQVPVEVLVTLNGLSEDELRAMYHLGESMEAAELDVHVRVAMVH